MTVSLRPVNPDIDFPRMAAIMSSINPEPTTAEELREWQEQEAPGTIRQRTAAIDERGYFVGYSDGQRDPWMKQGRFWLTVRVDPAFRGRGTGKLLYTNVLQFVLEQGATELEGQVRDDLPEGLRFAERRGFHVDRHIFESTLDLLTFDETRFAGTIEAVEATGIRFTTLADLGNTVEAQRRLYEVNRRATIDIPGRDEHFAPFEEFSKFVFGASWYRADGQIVAIDGDEWVGMAAIGYFDKTNSAYNMVTGVDKPYRNRKLGLALKLLALRCARKYGATYIRTNNDSENAPILAINQKLGYRPLPGEYLLLNELSGSG